jgi:hypothetical protein
VGLGLFGPAGLGLVAQVKEKGKGFALYRTANSFGLMLRPVIGGVLGSINLITPSLQAVFYHYLPYPRFSSYMRARAL